MTGKKPTKKQIAKALEKDPPEEDKPICFTIQPFKGYYGEYWETVYKPAIEEAGMEPKRGDSIFSAGQVIDHIWELTQRADVILAELTTKNANVYYELGLAHALAQPTVLIAEENTEIPFDIHHQRRIIYNKNFPDWGETLRKDITRALKATLDDPIKAVPPTFIRANEVQPTDYDISDIEKRLLFVEQALSNVRYKTRGMKTQFNIFGNKFSLYDVEVQELKLALYRGGEDMVMDRFNQMFPAIAIQRPAELKTLVEFIEKY